MSSLRFKLRSLSERGTRGGTFLALLVMGELFSFISSVSRDALINSPLPINASLSVLLFVTGELFSFMSSVCRDALINSPRAVGKSDSLSVLVFDEVDALCSKRASRDFTPVASCLSGLIFLSRVHKF